MTFSKIKLIINTVKHLKFKQVQYRIYYLLRNKLTTRSYSFSIEQIPKDLFWNNYIYNENSYLTNRKFHFLNIKHNFENQINWNFNTYGKLWTYNLNYFDYLNQDNITKEQGLFLINDFIKNKETIIDGFEPYPISKRGINWIKFLSTYHINEIEINTFLYNDFLKLFDNLEYHILGNHLLENGYALLFGAFYFENKKFYTKAFQILTEELEEQILSDGAHFELSPMYHQILLAKLLDCIHLISKNTTVFKSINLINLLEKKANSMLCFLKNITFSDGTMPLLNDASNGIAPSYEDLFNYAQELNLSPYNLSLKVSGYRKKCFKKFEIIMDVGKVGPDYQPGHAHADTFNFCMHYNHAPIIVDTGTSTYNIGERRDHERSTIAHNTVVYNHKNSSEIWGGFRVANRAEATILKDVCKELIAEHNGYKKEGVIHQRKFEFLPEGFKIKDKIEGSKKLKSISSIHFHPKTVVQKFDNYIIINNILRISWSGFDEVKIKDYQFAPKFNVLEKALKIEGNFINNSEFEIRKI